MEIAKFLVASGADVNTTATDLKIENVSVSLVSLVSLSLVSLLVVLLSVLSL